MLPDRRQALGFWGGLGFREQRNCIGFMSGVLGGFWAKVLGESFGRVLGGFWAKVLSEFSFLLS